MLYDDESLNKNNFKSERDIFKTENQIYDNIAKNDIFKKEKQEMTFEEINGILIKKGNL